MLNFFCEQKLLIEYSKHLEPDLPTFQEQLGELAAFSPKK
jgi:hypothetical protein